MPPPGIRQRGPPPNQIKETPPRSRFFFFFYVPALCNKKKPPRGWGFDRQEGYIPFAMKAERQTDKVDIWEPFQLTQIRLPIDINETEIIQGQVWTGRPWVGACVALRISRLCRFDARIRYRTRSMAMLPSGPGALVSLSCRSRSNVRSLAIAQRRCFARHTAGW